MSQASEDIFDRLDAKDGYHVVSVEVGNTIALYAQAYEGGAPYVAAPGVEGENGILIKEWRRDDGLLGADYGECTRLRLLLDAAARYFTTGGNWTELQLALTRLSKLIHVQLTFWGYYLFDSYSTTEGTYQHVFVRDVAPDEVLDRHPAVLWEEPAYTSAGELIGGFIDKTDLETLRQQEDDDDDSWQEEARGEGSVAGSRDDSSAQLPAGTDPDPAPEAD